MNIDVKALTTCTVEADGEAIEMGFLNAAGEPMTLRMPFDNAQSIAMTLPALLSRALRQITGDDQARYVFPLGRWSIEADGRQRIIMTLATEDGFAASFGLPPEACRSLGWALKQEVDQPDAEAELQPPAIGELFKRIN